MMAVAILTIVSICVAIYLAMSGKIPEEYHLHIIYATALSMIYTTTLAGPYLVGSDVHLEYYFVLLRHGADVWQPLINTPQGTNIFAYVTPPNMWAYKLVYPAIFATVPCVLYSVYKQWTTPKRALLGSFLVIAFSPFFLEIPTIPRQMLAEAWLVLGFGILLLKHSKYKYVILAVLGVLIPLTHYSVTIIAAVILLPGVVVALVRKMYTTKPLVVFTAAMLLVSTIYFPTAQDGAVARKVFHLYNHWAPVSLQVTNPDLLLEPAPEGTTQVEAENKKTDTTVSLKMYEPTVRSLFGYKLSSSLTFVFILFAWIIILLAFKGLWHLRKVPNFWLLGTGSLVVVLLCTVPGFSNTLNITRIAHLVGLTLMVAPFVTGNLKGLTALCLIFFVFTSGLAFELIKVPNNETFTVPYNYSLSGHRIDLGTTTTPEDYIARDYVIDNDLFPVVADVYGAQLFSERLGPMGPQRDYISEIPKSPRPVPEGYIFVRSRNTQDGAFTSWNGIGLRKQYTFEEWQLDFENDIVFQTGDSYVLTTPMWEE